MPPASTVASADPPNLSGQVPVRGISPRTAHCSGGDPCQRMRFEKWVETHVMDKGHRVLLPDAAGQRSGVGGPPEPFGSSAGERDLTWGTAHCSGGDPCPRMRLQRGWRPTGWNEDTPHQVGSSRRCQRASEASLMRVVPDMSPPIVQLGPLAGDTAIFHPSGDFRMELL